MQLKEDLNKSGVTEKENQTQERKKTNCFGASNIQVGGFSYCTGDFMDFME